MTKGLFTTKTTFFFQLCHHKNKRNPYMHHSILNNHCEIWDCQILKICQLSYRKNNDSFTLFCVFLICMLLYLQIDQDLLDAALFVLRPNYSRNEPCTRLPLARLHHITHWAKQYTLFQKFSEMDKIFLLRTYEFSTTMLIIVNHA